jgi:cobalt-zinc-cadmium efflux system outer membrane protein
MRQPSRPPAACLLGLGILLSAALLPLPAQPPGKKQYAFTGRVEQVDPAGKRLIVTNEPIEGWMGAMTMAFQVSNEGVLWRLAPGDRITAKVYEGDFTKLYDVALAPQPGVTAPANENSSLNLLRDVFSRPALDRKYFEDLALASNPTLTEAGALVRRSAAQARQMGLYPNPSFGYQGEQIRGGAFHGGEQGFFVQQTIPLGGKLGLRRDVFEQQRRAEGLGETEQRYRVLSEVGQSFYSALAALETVRIRQQLLSIASDAVQTAYQLANVGQADAPDVLQAEVEAEQAQADYIAALRSYLKEFRSLAALAGKPDLAIAPLAGELDPPPVVTEDAVEQVVRDSPSVKRARQEVLRAQAELKSARREAVPDLQVRGGFQQNFERADPVNGSAAGLQGFATAGIALPLFNRNQGNVQAARAELERAQAEVFRTQLAVRRAAEALVQTILADQQRAARYKNEMLPRALRAYQLYLAKYRQMGAAYPQVIVSQRTLFQLRIAYVHILLDLWRNAIALQNFTLSGALEPPAASGISSLGINLPAGGGPDQ